MCAEKLKAQQNRAHRKGFHIAKLHKMKAFNIRATAVCVRMKAANSVMMLMMLVIMNRSGAQDTGAYLGPHNAARDEVGVGALQWDDTVAAYAKNYASQRAGDCALQHSGGQYGENIFWGGTGKDWQPGDAVASWVGEKQYYDYDSNACTGGQECGHYTQVVWSQSQRLGCASVTCDNDAGTFIICNYDPPGNVAGQKPY